MRSFDKVIGGVGHSLEGGPISVPHGQVLDIWIVDTQGDPWYVGLTGLVVLTLDSAGTIQPLHLPLQQIMAHPADINSAGHTGDDRTLDKLVDGVNVTQDDTHMWLIPYTAPAAAGSAGSPPKLGKGGRVNEGEHLLRLNLGRHVPVVGVVVWNYNKHSGGWLRGARRVFLTLDGRHITPPAQSPGTAYYGDSCVWLRRAPSSADWDYAQVLRFGVRRSVQGGQMPCVLDDGAASGAAGHTWAWMDAGGRDQRLLKKAASVPGVLPRQFMAGFDITPNPCASLVQLKLLSSHGDPFYVGLHAVALLDAAGQRVRVSPLQVHASPPGATCTSAEDARQCSNLAYLQQGAAQSLGDALRPATTSSQAWLAPLTHSLGLPTHNSLFFALDQSVALGGIVLYNYGKNPERGAREYELWVDGCLLVCGHLLPADAAQGKALAQVIAFNSDVPKAVSSAVGSFGGASIVLTSRAALQATGQTGTGVVRCVDEGRVVEAGNTRVSAPPALANRPPTAAGL
jgi:hypothetical protein